MPGQSGLEFQRQMQDLGIGLPVIFVTGHGDIPMSVQAMKSGAIEFLTKPFREQELLDAIHQGIALGRCRQAQTLSRQSLQAQWDSLTAGEQDVVRRVTAGLLNKQVAAELGVSEITIKVRRAQAMRKLQVRTLAELVRVVDRLALHEPPSVPAGGLQVQRPPGCRTNELLACCGTSNPSRFWNKSTLQASSAAFASSGRASFSNQAASDFVEITERHQRCACKAGTSDSVNESTRSLSHCPANRCGSRLMDYLPRGSPCLNELA